MEQGSFAVIIAMIVIFIFLPAFYLRAVNSNKQIVNEALYFAARSLEDCVSETDMGIEQIALGYQYSDDPIMRVQIDEAKLLTEFEDVLFKCMNNVTKFNRIQRNIVCKILVYPDRYVIIDDTTFGYARNSITGEYDTDIEAYNYSDEIDRYLTGKKNDGILAPKYFTYSSEGDIIPIKKQGAADITRKSYYINTLNDRVKEISTTTKSWVNITDTIDQFEGRKYDMHTEELSDINGNLTSFDKNQAIINMINKDIMYYTDGVKVKITNPANTYGNNVDGKRKDFSFFNGITFLIIYKEEGFITISDNSFSFNQYNIAGYTLEN